MYLLNLNNAVAYPHCPKFIRSAALDVLEYGYLSAGQFFKALSMDDLVELSNMFDSIGGEDFNGENIADDEKKQTLLNLVLLTNILYLGEGQPGFTAEIVHEGFSTLALFTNTEVLHRAGLIELIHDNMQLTEPDLEFARVK